MCGFCASGKHKDCVVEYERFLIDPKGKVVYTGLVRKCECPKRGCKGYVRKSDRTRPKNKRRK